MGIVVRNQGRSGQILVTDERSDGTLLYLICRPWDSSVGGSGILVGPGEPPPEDQDLDGTFPLLYARREEPFRLTVDTTQLRGGPVLFRFDQFVDTAVEVAGQGVDHVSLDEGSAESWGLIEGP